MKTIRTSGYKKIIISKKWDTTGKYSLEVGFDEDKDSVYDLTHGIYDPNLNGLKQYLLQLPNPESAEIIIEFSATGSYSPQTWEEPEWTDEDRNYVAAYFYVHGQRPISINDQIGNYIFEKYENEIQEIDVDTDDTGYDPGY